MNKIKRVSLFFRVIFQMILVALPVLLIVGWVYAPAELVLLHGFIKLNVIPVSYQNSILHPLSASEKSLGALLSVIPLLVQMYVVYALIKLFRLYERGEIFSLRNVRYLRNIGYALLVGQLIEPFYQFFMGLVLTLHNPPHHRYAAITLDHANIGILLAALLVILISWIMAEGCKLREEQQLTI